LLGVFGTLKDSLDAAYAYPGGAITDRFGSRRALVLFGGLLIVKLGIERGMRIGFAASLVLGSTMLLGLRRAFRCGSPVSGTDEGQPRSRKRLPPQLRRLLAADILIRFCEGLPDVFIIVWVVEILRLSPARFGVLTYLFFTLYPLAILLSRSFLHLVGAFMIGGLREIGEPARKAFILDCADPASCGRTVGLYYAIRGFSVAGAATVGGFLWTVRPSLTFLTATALGVAGTAVCGFLLPSTPSTTPRDLVF
jgi:hypothetical protein